MCVAGEGRGCREPFTLHLLTTARIGHASLCGDLLWTQPVVGTRERHPRICLAGLNQLVELPCPCCVGCWQESAPEMVPRRSQTQPSPCKAQPTVPWAAHFCLHWTLAAPPSTAGGSLNSDPRKGDSPCACCLCRPWHQQIPTPLVANGCSTEACLVLAVGQRQEGKESNRAAGNLTFLYNEEAPKQASSVGFLDRGLLGLQKPEERRVPITADLYCAVPTAGFRREDGASLGGRVGKGARRTLQGL